MVSVEVRSVYGRYHIQATRAAVDAYFAPAALRQVLRANVMQDSLAGLFGADAHRHFCDLRVARGWAYVEEEHARIASLAARPGTEQAMRQAFGRLLHTVQDFYAHSNYVELWLRKHGGMLANDSAHVDDADDVLMHHPQLRTGDWVFWRDIDFYVPGLGQVIRRFWVPANSHEAINLDSPARGPSFRFALAMARQRTRREYRRTIEKIHKVGGDTMIARFHGVSSLADRLTARPHLHQGEV